MEHGLIFALEQTYNSEGKTSVFKGISHARSVRDKYIKAALMLTKLSQTVKGMTHMDEGRKEGRKCFI